MSKKLNEAIENLKNILLEEQKEEVEKYKNHTKELQNLREELKLLTPEIIRNKDFDAGYMNLENPVNILLHRKYNNINNNIKIIIKWYILSEYNLMKEKEKYSKLKDDVCEIINS